MKNEKGGKKMRKFILITLLCALVVFGCDDDNNTETHTHEWGDWQSNATEHWKECSCGEEYGRANHTGDPCTVCGYETPKHESMITAFDRTIAVKGDASISTADFNTAKGKLGEAMEVLSLLSPEGTPIYNRFDAMLKRKGFAILIKTGNAEPDADANKSMTIGVDYLLNNDAKNPIADDIAKKVLADNAFAD